MKPQFDDFRPEQYEESDDHDDDEEVDEEADKQSRMHGWSLHACDDDDAEEDLDLHGNPWPSWEGMEDHEGGD